MSSAATGPSTSSSSTSPSPEASAARSKPAPRPTWIPSSGTGTRNHWDSAAERYAATVTLFEMATGHAPVYGEAARPRHHPRRATVEPGDFDPTLSDALVPFFAKPWPAMPRQRFGTAEEMLAAWRAALSLTTDDRRGRGSRARRRAKVETPLTQSGSPQGALGARTVRAHHGSGTWRHWTPAG